MLANADKGLSYSKGDMASAKSLAPSQPSTIGERKKSTYTRKVLKFSSTGQSSLMEAKKVSITHTLGVQSRDLRLLDPQLATSYPSAILCRDQALIVNCEQVKCIITRHYLLLLNPEDETVRPFVEVLVDDAWNRADSILARCPHRNWSASWVGKLSTLQTAAPLPMAPPPCPMR